MEAIILAGGFGRRIQTVVSEVPKPMALVAGRPFLYYILQSLADQNIESIILAVGYKREAIINHFGQKFESVDLLYSVEEEPLGTGGGIRNALELSKDNEVIIINGDTFFDLSLKDLFKFHQRGSFDLTMSLKPLEHIERYGTVVMEQNRIVAMREKQPCQKGLINGGVYVMERRILEKIPLNSRFSFETDILEKEVNHLKFGGYISDSYFIDIGIPEDYSKAQRDFENRNQ